MIPSSLAPAEFFSFFSFTSFCLHVSSSSSFSSRARTFARTLACAHTRTYAPHQTRFRCPRSVTMRFGALVVPLHLVSLHRQRPTLFCPSRLFHVHLCLLRAHVLTLPPFRAGRGASFPLPLLWEACVWNPRNHRNPLLTTGEARRDAFSCTCVNKLLIGCCGPLVCFMVVHVPDVVPGSV